MNVLHEQCAVNSELGECYAARMRIGMSGVEVVGAAFECRVARAAVRAGEVGVPSMAPVWEIGGGGFASRTGSGSRHPEAALMTLDPGELMNARVGRGWDETIRHYCMHLSLQRLRTSM